MRRRIWRIWDRLGAAVMLAALAAVFVLGFIGITWHASLNELSIPVGTRLYLTASLFVLEGGDLDGFIPWPLEVARWAAPVVLATAALGTVISIARHRAWSWGVRRLSGHVVVVGLGERGWRVAQSAQDAGRRVVVIEADATTPAVRLARRRGIPVIVGDATDENRLRTARVAEAARVIVLIGDATTTTSIAAALTRITASPRSPSRPEFSCFLAVSDADAARDLNALTHEQSALFQREFFSLEERAGPAIVDRWGALVVGEETPGPFVVIGSGGVARSVVASIARQWTAQRAGADTLDIRWIVQAPDKDVQRESNDLATAPVRVTVSALAGDDPRDVVTRTLDSLSAAPTMLVVAESEDDDALAVLATAEQVMRGTRTAIIGVTEGPSLVRLLHGHRRIQVFDVADELCTDEHIARGRLESVARALHDGYLRQLNRTLTAEERSKKPAYRPWSELPAQLRDQNYAAGRAARGMLADLGYDIVPRSPLLPAVTDLDAQTIDALADAEHARWFRSRNPGATAPEWASVDPVHAEQSRDQARRLPVVLAAADLQITPSAKARS